MRTIALYVDDFPPIFGVSGLISAAGTSNLMIFSFKLGVLLKVLTTLILRRVSVGVLGVVS